jgi:hypothetical protein
MPGATSKCGATLIASDNGSNFERMAAAVLASRSLAFENVANVE